jgi:hypothetical protein
MYPSTEVGAPRAMHMNQRRELTGLSPLQNVYADQKLIGSSKKIRLIHLLPGHRDDPIRCTLHAVDFQQIEHFEALSYVWGSRLALETISMDRISFSVTENLLHALQHLRLVNRKRVLWIDAICINQSDINERNHQIRQMADIYSQAQRVIAWIGLETEASQAAFKFLTTSYNRAPFNRRELMDDPGWNALKDVYKRDYWKRVWIVQEICLAQRVVIMCGNTQIPWNYISEVRKTRKHCWQQYLSKGEREFMRSLLSRIDHAKETHQTKGCILWTLLESFEESQCQDIHDKIYGFVGLSSDCGNEDLRIDYSKSVSQLYRDVVWFHYRKFREDRSSPDAAQLMKFSEFLRGFLERHPQYSGDLEHEEAKMEPLQAFDQEITTDPCPSTVMHISASRMMRIDSFLSSKEAEKFQASELVDFLEGKTPYSHLRFWRGLIDPSVSEVYTVHTSQSFATGYVAMAHNVKQQEGIHRPSAFVTSIANRGSSPDPLPIIGIAPPSSKPGDMLCTFIDSHIALVMRAVPIDDTPIIPANQDDHEIVCHAYILIGRAYLDFQYLERSQQIKSRLTNDKTIELFIPTTYSNFSIQGTRWPVTLSIDMRTLQIVTKPIARPKARGFDEGRLELLPSTTQDIGTSCSHPFQRSIDSSELSILQKDPWLMQYIRGPGYVGITNLGATGYLSCTLQILYILKPFRTVIQSAVSSNDMLIDLRKFFELNSSMIMECRGNFKKCSKSFGLRCCLCLPRTWYNHLDGIVRKFSSGKIFLNSGECFWNASQL